MVTEFFIQVCQTRTKNTNYNYKKNSRGNLEITGIAYVGIHDHEKQMFLDKSEANELKIVCQDEKNKHPWVRRSTSQLYDIVESRKMIGLPICVEHGKTKKGMSCGVIGEVTDVWVDSKDQRILRFKADVDRKYRNVIKDNGGSVSINFAVSNLNSDKTILNELSITDKPFDPRCEYIVSRQSKDDHIEQYSGFITCVQTKNKTKFENYKFEKQSDQFKSKETNYEMEKGSQQQNMNMNTETEKRIPDIPKSQPQHFGGFYQPQPHPHYGFYGPPQGYYQPPPQRQKVRKEESYQRPSVGNFFNPLFPGPQGYGQYTYQPNYGHGYVPYQQANIGKPIEKRKPPQNKREFLESTKRKEESAKAEKPEEYKPLKTETGEVVKGKEAAKLRREMGLDLSIKSLGMSSQEAEAIINGNIAKGKKMFEKRKDVAKKIANGMFSKDEEKEKDKFMVSYFRHLAFNNGNAYVRKFAKEVESFEESGSKHKKGRKVENPYGDDAETASAYPGLFDNYVKRSLMEPQQKGQPLSSNFVTSEQSYDNEYIKCEQSKDALEKINTLNDEFRRRTAPVEQFFSNPANWNRHEHKLPRGDYCVPVGSADPLMRTLVMKKYLKPDETFARERPQSLNKITGEVSDEIDKRTGKRKIIWRDNANPDIITNQRLLHNWRSTEDNIKTIRQVK